MLELKFDGKKVIFSTHLRKVLLDLIEETDYSGEYETDIQLPVKKNFNYYRRYPTF